MRQEINKVYLHLGKKPLLFHTLVPFENSPLINEIMVMVSSEEIEYCWKKIIEPFHLQKVTQILPGGKERQDSIWEGIKRIPPDTEIVIVHDGARPLINRSLIETSIEAAQRYGAVVTALPLKETVKEVSTEQEVIRTPLRHTLMVIQTPQAFHFDILRKAYEKAYNDCFYGTDDASLVERLGIKVKVIPGSYENIKITTPEDLILAEALLKQKEKESLEKE